MSPEESKIIARILNRYSKDAGFLTLEYLVEEWDTFIFDIEQGYMLTIFDYTNSMGKRDFIEVVLNEVPEVVQNELLHMIEPLDSRFLQATKQVVEAVLPTLDNSVILGWWWYRVPKKLSDPPDDFQHWAPYYGY